MSKKTAVGMFDIDISEHCEFGKKFEWRCPNCGTQLRYYESAEFASVTECECGKWRVDLSATLDTEV